MGAFTRSDISHLLPVINVESDTAIPRQKDHTALAELCQLGPFIVLGQYYRQHLWPATSDLYPTVWMRPWLWCDFKGIWAAAGRIQKFTIHHCTSPHPSPSIRSILHLTCRVRCNGGRNSYSVPIRVTLDCFYTPRTKRAAFFSNYFVER